jgi:hypothetical protein
MKSAVVGGGICRGDVLIESVRLSGKRPGASVLHAQSTTSDAMRISALVDTGIHPPQRNMCID